MAPSKAGTRPSDLARVRNWSIGAKMLVVAAVVVIGLAATGLVVLERMADSRSADRADATRAMVEAGAGIVEFYGDREAAGELTQEEAQTAALDVVRAIRYGEGDYFWVHDADFVMQMHPIKPELDGTDIRSIEDPDGVRLFVEMNDVVAADGRGFVAYEWPKPGFDDPQPKISYVIGYEPWGWVIGSGVYVDDIDAAVASDRRSLTIAFAIVTGLIFGVILLVRRSITRPLGQMAAVLEQGDLGRRLDEGAGRTELDRVSTAINANLERVSGVVTGVVGAAAEVGEQVRQLTGHTQAIEGQAASMAEQADAAACSSREVTEGYGHVAQAVGEIDASIRSISDNVQNVADVANRAVDTASSTNAIVERLAGSSVEIGEVVRTITTIAEKTNLLALNATIESSRAGEAGRGFAVVANEVKDLAKATAVATETIAERIEALQADANESVAAIERIRTVVGEINEYQTGIASAVEEQSVTMSEVSRNVQESNAAEAAAGSAIDSVAVAAGDTHRQLDLIAESVERLASVSGQLEASVDVFQRS